MNNVQLFTTPIIDGMPIEKYYGIVTANQVAGTGFFTDLTASFSDFIATFAMSDTLSMSLDSQH